MARQLTPEQHRDVGELLVAISRQLHHLQHALPYRTSNHNTPIASRAAEAVDALRAGLDFHYSQESGCIYDPQVYGEVK